MDHNGSTGDRGEGNTKKTRAPLAKYWQLTLNNYTDQQIQVIEEKAKKYKWKYLIGFELAPTTGTPHAHIFVQSETRIRIDEKIKEFKFHWEKCSGGEDSNVNYITKECDKCIGNIKIKRKPKILEDEQLYEWQKELVEIIKNEPDDRTIYWYWSKEGMTGKTTFCKYLSAKYGAIPLEGKKNDILYCAAEFETDIYIWDLERSMEEYVSYGALEKIKNGYYMCAKYESKPIIRACPHIIVFANFKPEINKLSEDRWKIKNIGQEEEEEELVSLGEL